MAGDVVGGVRDLRGARGRGCTVVRSADGRTVEKRYDRLWWPFVGGMRHEPFERERRIGSLFRRTPPPVPTPTLVGADRRRRALVFEAVDGEDVGPKYPLSLDADDADGLVTIAMATERYAPRPWPRFLKRFDLSRRLRRVEAARTLTPAQADAFRRIANADAPRLVFAHGDVTARNVMRRHADGAFVLIDWEWAGAYPAGWELAFLWFTLVDAPGGRERVERAITPDRREWFWRSALLVQLLHLELPGLAPGSPFRAKHERMRDELVERVLS